jgi:hypothetical protein
VPASNPDEGAARRRRDKHAVPGPMVSQHLNPRPLKVKELPDLIAACAGDRGNAIARERRRLLLIADVGSRHKREMARESRGNTNEWPPSIALTARTEDTKRRETRPSGRAREHAEANGGKPVRARNRPDLVPVLARITELMGPAPITAAPWHFGQWRLRQEL